jgi:nicotinate-nucleotide--dimethylbenzimidazole phosphoribosyltransferase
MNVNKADSNEVTETSLLQCCRCGVAMTCGAKESHCWCQNFASVAIDPTRVSCECENCLRISLANERVAKRLTIAPLIAAELAKKTMPKGALGQVQMLAEQIALTQNTLKPRMRRMGMMVFASDHGLADEGISAYPKSVTWQMVMNFLSGGAAINVLANVNEISLQIVDAGVDHHFAPSNTLINAKIAFGTKNSLHQAAMSSDEFKRALTLGATLLTKFAKENTLDAVGFGEMGIGNTSAASLLFATLLKLDLTTIIGRGTGVDDAQLVHKISVLNQTKDRIEGLGPLTAAQIAMECAGFEIVMMAGAMQKATDLGIVFVVDGFIATSAFALALRLHESSGAKEMLSTDLQLHAVFAHRSAEAGHQLVLKALGVWPLFDLGLRLGEGSGAVLAMPLLRSAAAIMKDMATFDSAAVSNKE